MKVTIYSNNGCPECMKAEMLCRMNSSEYEMPKVGEAISKEELEEKVGKPVKTTPQIFVTEYGKTKYVGGYKELNDYFYKDTFIKEVREMSK